MQHEEAPLAGGNITAPVRVGDTVHRAAGPWTPTIHALLRHVLAQGFKGVPTPLGFDEHGREVLTYMEGEAGTYPLPAYMWSDETLAGAARLLRRYHDATASFAPPDDALWQFIYPDNRRHEVICHNDFAPYNMVFVDRRPQALIDFDTAGPGPRIWDVAYAVYRFVPLSWAGDMQALGLSDVVEQGRRLRLFCDAYGLEKRAGLLHMVRQRLQALCNVLLRGAANGNAAFQKMVDDGHVDFYRREIAAFREHKMALEELLSGGR